MIEMMMGVDDVAIGFLLTDFRISLITASWRFVLWRLDYGEVIRKLTTTLW
jgi:hypothetical protein